MTKKPLILGIESSCDETAAAIVRGATEVLSSCIATQHDLHEKYAGVVPEIASRAHLERITPVIREALKEAGIGYEDLDAIAIGHRPGLIGSLLVGVSAAKALAWSLNKPLIGVDHIHAHLHAGLLDATPVEYPALGLVVSGGHTGIFHLLGPLEIRTRGRTIDDAIGAAYDQAATILQIGYPGGPKLDALAQTGNDRAHDFPVSSLGRDNLNFSYSGLKTSFLYAVCGNPVGRGAESHFTHDASSLSDQEKADYAASFQRAAVRAIMKRLDQALDQYEAKTLLVGGGVSANSRLRRELMELGEKRGVEVRLPEMKYCLDNAAMIAGLGAVKLAAEQTDDLTLAASPRTSVA